LIVVEAAAAKVGKIMVEANKAIDRLDKVLSSPYTREMIQAQIEREQHLVREEDIEEYNVFFKALRKTIEGKFGE